MTKKLILIGALIALAVAVATPAVAGRGGGGGVKLKGGLVDTAATYLGLTHDQLVEARRAGKSLAQVAQEQGKPVQGLIDALVTAQKARIDSLPIDQARKDELLANVESRVTALVNATGWPRGHRC